MRDNRLVHIGFYHLSRSTTDKALPLLLERTLAAGQRAVVLCSSEGYVRVLDDLLWECAEPDWLPHGTAVDGDPMLQPIWLTTEDSTANGARFLFLVDGATSGRLSDFDRVFDIFDGNDEAAVSTARARWSLAKSAGHELTYWQQCAHGWEKKT